jgi:hypothetical protein
MAAKKSLTVLPPNEGSDGSACTRVVGGLTDEEVRLLEEMRRLKEKILALRGGDRSAPLAKSSRAGGEEAVESVDALKARMGALKREREEARRRRMAILGHGEED